MSETLPRCDPHGVHETQTTARPVGPLFLSHDADYDWLTAIEFGETDDLQPAERWEGVSDSFGWLLHEPGGTPMGFMIKDFSTFDPEDDEVASIWNGPGFYVPVLGLRDATAGEIALAAAVFLDGQSTLNRRLFDAAVAASGAEAVDLWRECLQAGDVMAHYGLGYTLYELGRHHEAYRHLRAYAELVPSNGWAWCWTGRAAHALGNVADAELAYRNALEAERAGSDETDAAELLEALRRRDAPDPDTGDDPSEQFARETLFDSADWLDGVDLPAVEGRPTALFLAGGPLSGKDTVLEHLRAESSDLVPDPAVLVSPAEIRELLPEWKPMLEGREANAAEFVSRETCHLARRIVTEAAETGMNLIIDGLGAGAPGAFARRLSAFAAAGYEVSVLLVDAPTELCQHRNVERARRTGLLIDPDELAVAHRDVSSRFHDWKDLPDLRFEMYSAGQ